jgi:superfamily I DNA and RNA helicase
VELERNFQQTNDENEFRKERIRCLEEELSAMTVLHNQASQSLAQRVEADRARVEDLIDVTIQTEIPTAECQTQTEFIVPPVPSLSLPSSLR